MHFAPIFASLLLAAAGAEDPSTDVARSLANQAQTDYDLGHYDAALKSYEALYKVRPVAGVLFNVAQCHRKLGQLKQAENLYRSFLVHADPESREAARAQELLLQVEEALKQQEMVARAAPQGTAPLSVKREPMSAPAPAVATPEVVYVQPPQAQPSHKTAYVLGSVAVAALAAGTVFGLSSKSAAHSLASSMHSAGDVNALANTYKHNAKLADLLFAGGGALALGAVIAW